MLLDKEATIDAKLDNQRSLELELEGMAGLLNEQINEKDTLLVKLEIKEKENRTVIESLENETKCFLNKKKLLKRLERKAN
ncbi:hypothetical protein GCM10009865_51870 [Aeromicrobium ponti]|uniref:Uncharacterized protein n=1 Tax=Cytobacillus oceanisediminis TaxID=665099 RepID=A0A562J6U1_9BACI|nr:hypothetical protein [Cytobacillus oceanisediminis]TWH78898.1 hypothetical protein IQ19_05097 [Cytobacillus oceanisediminis]